MLHRFSILSMVALQLLLFSPVLVSSAVIGHPLSEFDLRFFYYYLGDGRSILSQEIFGYNSDFELPCQSRSTRGDWLKFKNENSSFEVAGYRFSNCTGEPLFVISEPTPYYQTPKQWESYHVRVLKPAAK